MPDQEEGYAPYQEELPVEEAGEPETPTEATPEPEAPEEAEVEEVEELEHVEPEKDKKKPGSQRLKESLQREREARIMAEEARIKAESELNALKGGQQKPAERPAGRPKPEDFETHEEFVEAITDYTVAKALQEHEQSIQKELQRERWEIQKEVVREKHEDFDDVFERAPMPGPIVASALLKHKVGAEIAYYLGTHPAEYKRIDQLKDPIEVGFEMAEIAAKLSTPAAVKPTSKAPAPLSPMRGSAVAAKSESGYDPY